MRCMGHELGPSRVAAADLEPRKGNLPLTYVRAGSAAL